MPTRNQIIKIHALKGSLKLDDDTYRDILSGYGVKTSTKLSIVKADQLIDDLTKKAVAAGVWEKRKPAAKAKTRKLADDDQSKMIRGIWIELAGMTGGVRDSSEAALESYCKRMTGIQKLQWLDVKQAQLVIEALKKWRKRIEDADIDTSAGSDALQDILDMMEQKEREERHGKKTE